MTLEELQSGAGTAFLFHYTDAVRADLIVGDRLFVAGPSAVHGFGVYATDIAPVDFESIEDVITKCFGGDATPAEVDHVVVVMRAAGGLEFEQTSNPYEWVLPTAKLELVLLDELYVATLRFEGDTWVIVDLEE